jgi:predicted glycogen debranching enzyme
MESACNGVLVTPRQGLAVEVQALWVRACRVLAELAEQRADPDLSDRARQRAQQAQEAFRDTFWCHETNHPFDCMSEERESAEAWADPSIRPNALIALSVAPELFEPWHAAEIVARTEDLLLTNKGIRTLEPGHLQYVGYAGDSVEEYQRSSHQGAAWMHLLLFYVRAKLRVDPTSGPQLKSLIHSALDSGRALGHVAQTVDGDPPHRERGIPAYAIATGMLLEALAVDLADF